MYDYLLRVWKEEGVFHSKGLSDIWLKKTAEILYVPGNPTSLRAESDRINPLNTKRRLLYLKTQFVPRSKQFSSRL